MLKPGSTPLDLPFIRGEPSYFSLLLLMKEGPGVVGSKGFSVTP